MKEKDKLFNDRDRSQIGVIACGKFIQKIMFNFRLKTYVHDPERNIKVWFFNKLYVDQNFKDYPITKLDFYIYKILQICVLFLFYNLHVAHIVYMQALYMCIHTLYMCTEYNVYSLYRIYCRDGVAV